MAKPIITLTEAIHIYEHSRLQSEHFTEEAVTATYIAGLAALRKQMERENPEPMTIEEIKSLPDGSEVWVKDFWLPSESGYHYSQRFGKDVLLFEAVFYPSDDGCVPHFGTDGPEDGGYGKGWLAYREKPEEGIIE